MWVFDDQEPFFTSLGTVESSDEDKKGEELRLGDLIVTSFGILTNRGVRVESFASLPLLFRGRHARKYSR